MLLEEPRFSLTEKYLALQTIDYDGWLGYVKTFLWSCKLECLMTGNITEEESVTLQSSITDLLHLPNGTANRFSFSMDSQRRGVDLFHSPFASKQSRNIQYLYYQVAKEYNPQEANSAIENLYFIGIAANQSTAKKKQQIAGLIVDEEEETQVNEDGVYLECMIHLMTQIVSL